MENNFMMNAVFEDDNPEEKKVHLKKGYRKSEELINFANKKLTEIETRIGMQLSGFSELYDNMEPDDQAKFLELLKEAEAENHDVQKSKHQCTRKPKPRKNIKHGNRKKK